MMKKIVSTADILFGAPRVESTRISVYNIVSSLWHSREIEEYIDDFKISEVEIKNALSYCKNLSCQKNNVIKFCNGCLLQTINSIDKKAEFIKIDENLFTDKEKNFFIAENIGEIENEEFGYAGWIRAEELYNYYFSTPER
jgi:uncharacterized protein (DUF433 family)